jgi:imidazolonepropionase-like amidohydrolase
LGTSPWPGSKNVTIIDLGQATVLPGLIDAHSHSLVLMPDDMSGGESLTAAVALMSPEFRTLRGMERRMSNNAITQELVREARWWLISRSME